MHEQDFARRLHAATDQLLAHIRPHCDVALPDAVVYVVLLNSSFDAHADPQVEAVYPEDSDPAKSDGLRECGASQVVAVLCRDGRIPVWIDMEVLGDTGEATIVQLTCAGRYTDDESRFYHQHAGHPPFAFKFREPPNSSVELRSLRELQRLPRVARLVRRLTLVGCDFDDRVLLELPSLPFLSALELRDTGVLGAGMKRVAQEASLDSLHIAPAVRSAFDFGAVPELLALKHLRLGKLPSKLQTWDAHLRKVPNLEYLVLSGREDLEFDVSHTAGLSNLRGLELKAAGHLRVRGHVGRSLQHFSMTAGGSLELPAVLEQAASWLTLTATSLSAGSTLRGQFEMLSIHLREPGTRQVAELLAPVTAAGNLSLGGTPLEESVLDEAIGRLRPSYLNVVDCGLSDDSCLRISARYPSMGMHPCLS